MNVSAITVWYRRLIVSLVIIIFIGFFKSADAQDLSVPELQGFKKTAKFPVFTRENLKDYNGSSSDIYLTYGFIDLNIVEYRKGKNIIRLEIYRLSDNVMAFGIYSVERSSSFRFLNLGSQGYNTDGSINFFKGDFYVRIKANSTNEKSLQSAESLALRVANMLPGNNEMPALLSRFPETGKKVNEETFLSQNVLGHKFLTGAFKAVYELGPDSFSLFIIETKSSSDTWKIAEAYLKETGEEAPESETGKYMLTDRYNGTIFMAWAEKTIVIITGLSKDQSDIADQYASQITGR
jgi:hypothetical protein